MKNIKAILFFLSFVIAGSAQQDTITHSRSLDSVIIISYLNQNIIRPLPVIQSFADALNAVEPAKATAAVGLVQSYALLDLNASFCFSKNPEARVTVSNVTDKQYFTNRPTFYQVLVCGRLKEGMIVSHL